MDGVGGLNVGYGIVSFFSFFLSFLISQGDDMMCMRLTTLLHYSS